MRKLDVLRGIAENACSDAKTRPLFWLKVRKLEKAPFVCYNIVKYQHERFSKRH